MRHRSPAPMLLAMGSRFAGLSQRTARIVLAVLVTLGVLVTVLIPTDGSVPFQADAALQAGIVEALRHGGTYYAVAAEAMRGGGYPLQPFFAMRLPTLAVIAAALPAILVRALLWALAAATVLVWHRRLAPEAPGRAARAGIVLLLLAGVAACLQSSLIAVHEVWAGLFVALSLGCRRPARWIEAVAFGLAAALIRETAVVYLIAMMVLAIRDAQRREAIGWALAIGILAVVVGAHAHAVSQVVGPLDAASPGWSGLLGVEFVGQAVWQSTALALLPAWLAAPLATLALFGWIAWRDADGLRVAATLLLYALLLGTIARADDGGLVLLVAPLWLLGLVFAVDGLRDLIAAARDSRRITVTRIVR